MPRLRLGIDVGGTFTDLYVLDEHSGDTRVLKMPSTPADPSQGIITAVRTLLEQEGAQGSDVHYFARGTTVATNALIQHTVARAGLLTTRGFRDLLEIGRQTRPDLYDLQVDRPEPLIRRDLRYEVTERVASDGSVYTPLDLDDAAEALAHLQVAQVEAVGSCFLFAYLAPEHEVHVKALVAQAMPEAYLSVSHEVLPEFRGYERLSTTVVNAALGPVVSRYVAPLAQRLDDLNIATTPYITQSNGGTISLDLAQRDPVRTVLSGPSTGGIGAAVLGQQANDRNLITFDMGGTSTDVSLVEHGQPQLTTERDIEGYLVKTPMIDVHTVGAGGGSIAWIDRGGLLKVGPQSAGADSGPVCYGLGGTEVTVTDANVAFGGAGPLHAGWVARELGIGRILIPPRPGLACAAGLLVTDVRSDYTRSRLISLNGLDVVELNTIFEDLEEQGNRCLTDEEIAPQHRVFRRAVDMRYLGQNYELTVPVPQGPLGPEVLDALRQGLYRVHERTYGYATADEPIELVTFRLEAQGVVPKARLTAHPIASDVAAPTPVEQRQVYLGQPDGGMVACPVYLRQHLQPGQHLRGPAVIEQLDTTTVILPEQQATIDRWGTLVISCATRSA